MKHFRDGSLFRMGEFNRALWEMACLNTPTVNVGMARSSSGAELKQLFFDNGIFQSAMVCGGRIRASQVSGQDIPAGEREAFRKHC